MKKLTVLLLIMLCAMQVKATEQKFIRISTDATDLILQVAPNGRILLWKQTNE